MIWTPRLATSNDIPEMEQLIPLSVRSLQATHYSPMQLESALGPVFGVDRQLIHDRSYFVVEQQGEILGCGGWSKRRSLFGVDAARSEPDPELNPAVDPARIRAFFVHPAWARRGIRSSILAACEEAIQKAHFRVTELVATLTGEPFYAAHGYIVAERYEVNITSNVRLPVVRTAKVLSPPD